MAAKRISLVSSVTIVKKSVSRSWLFGRKTRPRRCASSWREPKVPDTWIATLASGRSIAKLATFETIRLLDAPVAELAVESLALVLRGLAGDEVDTGHGADLRELLQVHADDEHAIVGVALRAAR